MLIMQKNIVKENNVLNFLLYLRSNLFITNF